jgi:hypothetical protein
MTYLGRDQVSKLSICFYLSLFLSLLRRNIGGALKILEPIRINLLINFCPTFDQLSLNVELTSIQVSSKISAILFNVCCCSVRHLLPFYPTIVSFHLTFFAILSYGSSICSIQCVATLLWPSVRVKPNTWKKVRIWSPPGLPNVQSSTARPKTLCIEVFLMSLERSWSVDIENGLALVIWTSVAQVMGRRRQFDSQPLKVGNRPLPDIRIENAIRCWKDLDAGYKFGSDFVAIRLCSRELWAPKVPGLHPG